MRKMLIVLIMLMMVSGAALGQELPPVFCGDLSEADCAILEQSTTAMRELESAAFDFDMNFTMQDIPDSPIEEVSFRLTGEGAYAVDTELMNSLATNPAALLENPEELPEVLGNLIKSISADATIVLFFPPNLTDTASSNGTTLPSKAGLSIRLVDGVGYINLDKLAALDTAGDMPRGWVGLDIAAALDEIFAQADLSSLGSIPGYDPESMAAFYDPALMGKFISITRGEDVDSNGQNAATFDYAMDLGALYADPDYQDLLRNQLLATYESLGLEESITDDDINMVLDIYAQMFDGFVIDMSQTIGLDDHFIHAMNLSLDWSLDLDSMAGQFGSTSNTPPLVFGLSFQGNLSQFNDAPTITAPEDAQLVPLDDLFGPSFGGGSFS